MLVAIPADLHLLASLPALAALSGLAYWAKERSKRVARVSLRSLGLTLLALAAWSLWHSVPGLVGMTTGLVATIAVYWILQTAHGQFPAFPPEPTDGVDAAHDGPWLHLVAGLAALSMAYAPPLSGVGWGYQFAFGLVVLALLWTEIAFRVPGRFSASRLEILINSALLTLVLAVAVGAAAASTEFPATPLLALLLLLVGGDLLWLAVELRLRWMVYGALGAWGVAAFVFKRTYFPGPSVGLGEVSAALALWAVLWWLDRPTKRLEGREPGSSVRLEATEIPRTVLWRFPVASS